jgi:hypothetical protein
VRSVQSRTIDGSTFTVQQLPAMQSVLLLHRLAKTMGGGLLKVLAGAGGGGGPKVDLRALDVDSLIPAMESFFDRFSEADLERLLRQLLETATVQGKGGEMALLPVFDVELQGKPMTVFKLLAFALEVNYRDFFSALLALASREGSASGA